MGHPRCRGLPQQGLRSPNAPPGCGLPPTPNAGRLPPPLPHAPARVSLCLTGPHLRNSQGAPLLRLCPWSLPNRPSPAPRSCPQAGTTQEPVKAPHGSRSEMWSPNPRPLCTNFLPNSCICTLWGGEITGLTSQRDASWGPPTQWLAVRPRASHPISLLVLET